MYRIITTIAVISILKYQKIDPSQKNKNKKKVGAKTLQIWKHVGTKILLNQGSSEKDQQKGAKESERTV